LHLFRLFFILPITLWVFLKKKISGEKININAFLFDGASDVCRAVKENAAKWSALNIMYNYVPGRDKNLAGKVTDFYNQLNNVKAIRNRLRLVKQNLREYIQEFSQKGEKIRIVSIACGSAQGITEVLKEFRQKGIFPGVYLLDSDPTAIEYAQGLAIKTGVSDQVKFFTKSTTFLNEIVGGWKPQIIEVTGLFEYLPYEKAISLVKRINDLLATNGVLITSNISANIEMFFTHFVSNWPLIYRKPKDLFDIVSKAGFSLGKCKIIQEPLRIHNILICRK